MKEQTMEELDIAIPDMLTESDEMRAGQTLKRLPGVGGVRMVQRGALVSYRAASITKDEICHALRELGYRASVFQDSKTGQLGHTPA